ncbi:MAG: alpha/beta hydrolase family protein [Bacilli bacterium]|jgi:pimeloyl-ACP methyl ester carboxylesterase
MQKYVELKKKENVYLRGYLNNPETSKKIVVMFHGFTGHKAEHGRIFRTISELLAKENIASLRFDFYGNAESDGAFHEFTFDTLVEDAKLIIDYAFKIKNIKKIILLGFSMGGAIAGYMASKMPEILEKLVLWSPAGNIAQIVENYFSKYPKLENGNVDFLGFEMSEDLVKSFKKFSPYLNLEKIKCPCLIVHGKEDLAVNVSFGEKYAKAIKGAKLIVIENAGHGYDNVAVRSELLTKTVEFLKG